MILQVSNLVLGLAAVGDVPHHALYRGLAPNPHLRCGHVGPEGGSIFSTALQFKLCGPGPAHVVLRGLHSIPGRGGVEDFQRLSHERVLRVSE